ERSTTWTPSSGSASAPRTTRSGSPSLDGSGRPRDGRLEPNLRLADTNPGAFEREASNQGIGDSRGHRLEQLELTASGDLLHAPNHLAVIDGVLEAIRRGRVRDLEPEVVEEGLRRSPFLLLDSMRTRNLETVQLHRDAHPFTASVVPMTARAAASASTCSRTSCTRKIEVPRSYASTAAPRLAAAVPVFASGSPMILPSELLREMPTRIGR